MRLSGDKNESPASAAQGGTFKGAKLDFIDHGEMFHFSGRDRRMLKVPNPICKLKESERLTPRQKAAYLKVIEELLPVCRHTNSIAAKQFSDGSLELITWLGKAVENVPESGTLKKLKIYHMVVSQNLSQFDVHDGAKYSPGFTKEELKQAISSIKDEGMRSEILSSFDKQVERIFSSEPIPPNANLFRFKTNEDRQTFLQGLGDEYKELQGKLEQAMEEPGARSKMARISGQMTRIQEDSMKTQVKASGGERISEQDTVVEMSYVDGKMKTKAIPYGEVFKPELEAISECFRKASEAANEVSPKLSEQLALLSQAVLSGDYSKADDVTYGMTANDSYLSVGFNHIETYAETVLQVKGVYDFRISIAVDKEEPIFGRIREDSRFKGKLNIGEWDNFVVAGFGFQFTLGGQKLPNESGKPLYLDTVFTNMTCINRDEREAVTKAVVVLPNGEDDLQRALDAVDVGVATHEAGHVLGSLAEHLEGYNNPTEECQATSSGILLTKEIAPEHVRGLMLRTATFGPIYAKVGYAGAHAKADLYITGRLLDGGALRINSRNKMEVVDFDRAVDIAAQIAKECRLLEKPIDNLTETMRFLSEELSGTSKPVDEKRVLEAARAKAEKMFGDENMERIVKRMEPVKEHIASRPVAFFAFGYLEDPLNRKI